MFPCTHGALGALGFLTSYFALQALAGVRPLRLDSRGAVGAVTIALWLLFVRLLDDVHDAPQDIRLGKAGDPRYRNRPLVTGEVELGEVRGLAVGIGLLLVALAGSFGPGPMLVALLGGLAVTWLGFRWFFVRSWARHPPPAAYLARKSLAVLLGGYAVVVFLERWPAAALTLWTIPVLLAPIFAIGAWEIARKIRLPADETEYGTYSKQFGWRRAALLPLGFALLTVGCLVPAGMAAGLEGLAVLRLLLPLGPLGFAVGRLLLHPTAAHADLRRWAEAFAGALNGVLLLSLVSRHGFQLG